MTEVPATAIAARDPWDAWRDATRARVALGRAGAALPTSALLAFELDHARARDAVHRTLDVDALDADLRALGLATLRVASAAGDRATYLLRPDLGRRLDDASRETLQRRQADACDAVFIVADGLSALAVQRHAVPVLAATLPLLAGLAIGPVVIAEQARVALGDEIASSLNARIVIVAIGERPGLTSPDSLGLYLTFSPRVGRHDAERNCISNVRPEGLAPADAATRLAWLVHVSLRSAISGVALKDDSRLVDAWTSDANDDSTA
jgi:ethanolamine ammonia-lyase small subunit